MPEENNKTHEQRESFKKKLSDYGICQKKIRHGSLIWGLIIATFYSILTLLAVVFLVEYEFLSKQSFDWSKVAQPIITLGIAAVVYKQWVATRHEISIDKYYDRLDDANDRLEKAREDNDACLVSSYDMHIFSELDKLEYVIVKYELGYIPPELALRAVQNFEVHCKVDKGRGHVFLNRASELVCESAYLEQTRTVVEKILVGTSKKQKVVTGNV